MFGKIREGLKKTREALSQHLQGMLGGGKDSALLIEELEEALILADVGVPTMEKLVAGLKKEEDPKTVLVERIMRIWPAGLSEPDGSKPWVHVFVGVNGVGKTTTIGKLAKKRTGSGQKGVIAACDTFRAAAIEQLEVWAERSGAELVRQSEGSDPAAVAFDAVSKALSRNYDFCFIDTAGRLHVKHNLMEELQKITRVVGKAVDGAPHQVSLVLDATTGQNGLAQAREFLARTRVTDLVLTKLDGSAKGGIALSIADELRLPISYVGVGESVEDLVPFDSREYTLGLFS
ncbi:MAG TPA: signal recognition particle-docking protein FtsY [Acidobacteriota bacterium]|jgi:fused signal recognition particle receptor|nr:signal recognition particle-docking protein FtsY [Acidobacteriota bacterium]HNT17934.1 signal recognition particle-docking protein FtsY [Acidobacteriota bacterium]